MKRFLLADDNLDLRSALRLMLETCLNAPDCIILDWKLPGLSEPDHLSALRHLLPDLKIIVTSARPEAAAAASARADAFISKTDPPAEILNAIRRLINGKDSPCVNHNRA